MAVRIRLARRGGRNESRWRVVVANKTTARDGKFIEIVGHYDPEKKSAVEKMFLKTDRVQYWLSKGAEPSEVVRKYLGVLGILGAVDYSNYTKKKPKGEAAEKPAGGTPVEGAPAVAVPAQASAPEQKEEQKKPEQVTETA